MVKEERTQFTLTGDHKAFWMPGDYDTKEYSTVTSNLIGSAGQDESGRDRHRHRRRTFSATRRADAARCSRRDDGLYINIHEAALVDYSAMTLERGRQELRA